MPPDATGLSVGELAARLRDIPDDVPVFFAYQGQRRYFPEDTATQERWDEVCSIAVEHELTLEEEPEGPDNPALAVIRG